MNHESSSKNRQARAAGLEMLSLSLIAIGILLACSLLVGGNPNAVMAATGIVAAACLSIGLHIKRKAQSLLWASEDHCPGCGYDLQSAPDRCSNCGLQRTNWPKMEPAIHSAKRVLSLLVGFSIIAVVSAVVFCRYPNIPIVRWTSLAVLILGFVAAAVCFFRMPYLKKS